MKYRTVLIDPHTSAEHHDLLCEGWMFATTNKETLSGIPMSDFLYIHKTEEAADDVLRQLERGAE